MTSFSEESLADHSGSGLRGYLDVVRRRVWIVVAVTVAAVALAVLFSLLQKPVYRAQMKIVIGQGSSLFQVPNGNVIQPFTATMSDLLRSNIVASTVVQSLRLQESPEKLLESLHVSINPDTAVITASYDSRDPEQAQRVLQQVGLVFSNLVKQRFGATPSGQTTVAPITATVFDPAHVLPGKVSPRPVRNVGLALVLGLILGLLAAFLREHFDRAVRTRDEVERSFGTPVIGQVPFERTDGKDERFVAWSGAGETAEAYRGLRANLQYLAVQHPVRTVLVTSASAQQGKTTVVSNLAVAIARSGASVVAVEADLRLPRLDTAIRQPSTGPGLTSLLVGSATLDDALREVPLPDNEGGRTAGRLAFMPSGPLPPNPSELLSSPRMDEIIDKLTASFDYVLIDSPPVLLVADALELARKVDGVVLAVRRNRASTDEGRELHALIERLGIHLLGAVFTDVEPVGSYVYGESGDQPTAGRSRARDRKRREPVVTEEV